MSGFGMLSFHRQSSSCRITKSGSFQSLSVSKLTSGRSSAGRTGTGTGQRRESCSPVQRNNSNLEKDMHVNERLQ